jgi:hypothetical protein
MPTREELIQQVEAKRRRQDLIRRVEEKRQRETASSSESEDEESSGLADSVSSIARTVDSYTGAPIRKGIGALQEGKSVREAAGEAWEQVGEDPSQAPTGDQIAKKAGFSDKRKVVRTAEEQRKFDEMFNPGMASSQKQIGKNALAVEPYSDAEVVGFGIEAAADVTNALPFAGAAKRVATGAVKGVSKAANLAADAADAVYSGAGKAGKRMIQGGFGVPEESITRYLSRHSELKGKVGAREMAEELAGRLDEGLKPHRANLAQAEAAVERAKAMRSENMQELLVKRQEAQTALKRAEDQALGEAASRLSSRVQQLDKRVSEGSAKSFQILDQEGVRVPVTPLKSDLTKGINAMRPVTDEQVAVVELLKRYRDRLDQFGNDMPGGEAKRIIQSLDREMKHLAPGEVGRLGREDQVMGILRKRFDTPLKASDEYAKTMEGVSSDMRTLGPVQDLASESNAARALRAAQSATGKDKADAIRALTEKMGGEDLIAMANSANLPESHKLRGLVRAYNEAKKGQDVQKAQAALEAIRTQIGDAVDLGKDGLAGIKDKISATVRRTDPSNVALENLKKAGDLTGVNMSDELADIRTIASFEKGYNRGSANTNFWGAVAGGTTGSVLGPGGAVGGVVGGAAFGRMVIDNFGPKVGRIILDQVPLLQKTNPAKWIRSLAVSTEVKARLAQDLLAYKRIGQTAKGGVAASKGIRDVNEMRKVAEGEREQNRAPAKGEAAWISRGAEKLGLSSEQLDRLTKNPKTKQLIIHASDLPAGSERLGRIIQQLKEGGAYR